MSKIENISDLSFFKEHCQDVRACNHCGKTKHHTKMQTSGVCIECNKIQQRKLQAAIRKKRKAENARKLDLATYPLSQSWSKLGEVMGRL